MRHLHLALGQCLATSGCLSPLWKRDTLLENLNWTAATRAWAQSSRWGRGKWGSGSGILEVLQSPVESKTIASGAGILTWAVGLHLGVCGWVSPGWRASWYQIVLCIGPEVPGCSRCDFLGYWDCVWKHQGIGGWGPQGPKRGLRGGESWPTDWVCKDTSGTLPPCLAAPAFVEREGTLGPPGTRWDLQLLRA